MYNSIQEPIQLDVSVLTITNSDFSLGVSVVNWTPKDSDYSSLVKNDYVGFIHLKDTGESRETIAKFFLYIEDA